MKRVSVTIDADVLERARRCTRAVCLSVGALRLHIQQDSMRAWLEKSIARTGPIPEEILAEADRLWPAS